MRLLPATLLLLLPSLGFGAEWPSLAREAAPQGLGENDAAVVVGIEKYAFVAGISGAAQNAADWHLFLTHTRQVPLSHVRLLRDAEGSLEQLRSEAQWAAGAVRPGGTLWFVFIGHGAPSRDGRDGVLVGVDAQQRADSLFARSFPQRELLQILAGGAQARTVVILDACFSGRSSSGQELVRGLQPLIAVQATKGVERALLFTAGKSDQFAGPLPGADRPAFSYLMLGALRGWADRNHDGSVTAREAVEYAQEALLALVKDRRQTPELVGAPDELLATHAVETSPDLGELVRGALPAEALAPAPRPQVVSPRGRPSSLPWVALGVGGAALVGSAVALGLGRSATAELTGGAVASRADAESLGSSRRSSYNAAIGLALGGAAAGALGLGLLLSSDAEPGASLSPGAIGGGAGLALTGRLP